MVIRFYGSICERVVAECRKLGLVTTGQAQLRRFCQIPIVSILKKRVSKTTDQVFQNTDCSDLVVEIALFSASHIETIISRGSLYLVRRLLWSFSGECTLPIPLPIARVTECALAINMFARSKAPIVTLIVSQTRLCGQDPSHRGFLICHLHRE